MITLRPCSNTTLDSKSFLNACKQYVKIYDTLGGGTKLVKRDILSNIKKIEELTAHNGTSNIFEIITKEVLHIKNSTTFESSASESRQIRNLPPKTVSSALLWLNRGFHLFHSVFTKIIEGEENLVEAFQTSYDKILSKFHSRFIRFTIRRALGWVGDLDSLILESCLWKDLEEDKRNCDKVIIVQELEDYINGMQELMTVVDNCFEKYGLTDAY